MIRVGITGVPGSGKTTIARSLAEKGIVIILRTYLQP